MTSSQSSQLTARVAEALAGSVLRLRARRDVSASPYRATNLEEDVVQNLVWWWVLWARPESDEPGHYYSGLDGTEFWLDDEGLLHREGDLPAVVRDDGLRQWYIHGDLHRPSGGPVHTAPAPGRVYYVQADGSGMPRRDSSGSVIRRNPDLLDPTVHEQVVEEWRTNDVLHREDGPARTWADGTQEWWVNGRRHRPLDEGPAVEYPPGYAGWESGPHEWCVGGQLHRTAGPALQSFVDVGGYRVIPGYYYLNGVHMKNVNRDWSILRHHTEEGPRRTLHVHNAEAWDALLSIGAVSTQTESIHSAALDIVLALNPN